ncbi:UNVERIFIED_CONTAM: putative PD-(D/E)XK family protein DUF4420 [Williamsia faeni]
MMTKLRHTPFSTIAKYDANAVGGAFDVEGKPFGRIEIAPQGQVLSLLIQVVDNVAGPDLRDLANLDYRPWDFAGTMWHRLDVTYGQNLAEVYPFLCTILDRVQLSGESFTNAVESALTGLGDILSGPGGLSREQQIGLFGELLVLISISRHSTPSAAIAAWRGPDREEHDFGLLDGDLEVKTTTAERRTHWISSFTQLLPSSQRTLHLLSIQVTGAANGPGASLMDLVEVARSLPGIDLPALDRSLRASGYREHHADLYRTKWALRSTPRFYLVDTRFPALTADRVAATVPNAGHIKDVRYRLELDGLEAVAPLFPVTIQGEPVA